MAVTEAEVRLAYLLMLGREPESREVLSEKVLVYKDFNDLRQDFVRSAEYKSKHLSLGDELNLNYVILPKKIDVDVSKDTFDRLMDRVVRQWSHLGEVDPYWSVITHDEYRADSIDVEKLKSFYESGRANANLIDIFEQRSATSCRRDSCFELGCGVGRVTRHLADKFDKVIAADISPGNLAICRKYLSDNGINNVETLLIETPEQLLNIGDFGFFYSVIVLQHNPPPIQKFLLDASLRKLLPGGGCLFQVPDSFQDYEFDADRFIEQDDALIDTHCMNRSTVLDILQTLGLRVRDVVPDPWLGPCLGSYTYFATKPM